MFVLSIPGCSAFRHSRNLYTTQLSLIELWLLITIGGDIGFLWTLFEFVLSAFLGFFLLKAQGVVFLAQLRDSFNARSAHQLTRFGVQAVGALLLIIPGFLSDMIGALLVLPLLWKLTLVLLGKDTLDSRSQPWDRLDQ